MKRIALLVVLLALVAFLVPTYAGKPVKEPEGIKVSDAQGNFLGMLMRHETENWSNQYIQIFIPSMGKFIDALGYELEHIKSILSYETYDCTDDAFIGQDARFCLDHLYHDTTLGKTFVVTPSQVRIVTHSYFSLVSGECETVPDPGDEQDVYPLVEIADVPIPLPIQFPFSYEY